VAAAAADSGRTLVGTAILNADTLEPPALELPLAAGLAALLVPSRDSPCPTACRAALLLLSCGCFTVLNAALLPTASFAAAAAAYGGLQRACCVDAVLRSSPGSMDDIVRRISPLSYDAAPSRARLAAGCAAAEPCLAASLPRTGLGTGLRPAGDTGLGMSFNSAKGDTTSGPGAKLPAGCSCCCASVVLDMAGGDNIA
jgi:hypothetical protein